MASHQLSESDPSARQASPTAATAARMLPPSIVADADPEPSPQLEPKDGKPATPLAAAVDGDVEALARLAARAGADRPWLRRIKMKLPSCSFHRGMARAGEILGGAYRRSFVACYVSMSSALCVRCYRRSFVAGYVAKVSARCARLWGAVGVVFNPLPAGSQLLPVSDPSLISERLCFTPDMERLHLLVLTVFVGGTVLFVSLERLLVAFKKACDFYNNVEWLRMEMARERPQLPPPVGQQKIPPPAAAQQLTLPAAAQQLTLPAAEQQLTPPAAEQQQLPPPAAAQQLTPAAAEQQLTPPAAEQQQLPPPLPPELDLC